MRRKIEGKQYAVYYRKLSKTKSVHGNSPTLLPNTGFLLGKSIDWLHTPQFHPLWVQGCRECPSEPWVSVGRSLLCITAWSIPCPHSTLFYCICLLLCPSRCFICWSPHLHVEVKGAEEGPFLELLSLLQRQDISGWRPSLATFHLQAKRPVPQSARELWSTYMVECMHAGNETSQ